MSKKNKLLSYLQNFPGWHTSQELAIQLELSKTMFNSLEIKEF